MPEVTAADIMTTKVITLTPHMHIYAAMEVLLKHRISGAPVLEHGRLVGVLSEYDCMAVSSGGMTDLFEATSGPVSQYMTAAALTASPQAPIGDLAATFLRQRVRRLPILDDDGRLVGLVSRRDVLKGLLRSQDGRRAQPAYPDYRRPR